MTNNYLQNAIVSVLARTMDARAVSDLQWHLPGWKPNEIEQGLRALVIMGIVERGTRQKDGATIYWLAMRREPEMFTRGFDVDRFSAMTRGAIVTCIMVGLLALVLVGYWKAP